MMRSISTEGICGLMWLEDKNRLSMVLFILAIIIMLVNPFLITNPNIDNADASTYVVVPVLMLPLLALFIFKKKVEVDIGFRDVAVGTIGFLGFVLITLYARFLLSYSFMSYRVDMLLFPIALFSISTLLFGLKNIQRFRAIMLYSLLASPIVLMPLLSLNGEFAQVNSLFVYYVLRTFSSTVSYTPPFSISSVGNYTIGIGEACAGIAVFIALVLFLYPVAYLFEGKTRNKIAWIFSGFVLLFALNFLRMTGIAAVWLLYSLNGATQFVHLFVGILLFYITIIVMMLVAPRYGLTLLKSEKRWGSRKRNTKTGIFTLSYILAISLAVLYYLVSLSYLSMMNISPMILNNKIAFDTNNPYMSGIGRDIVNRTGWTIFTISYPNNVSEVITLSNETFNGSNPIVVFLTAPIGATMRNLIENNTLVGSYTFVDKEGLKSTVYDIISNDTTFFVTNTRIPYVFLNNNSTVVDTYVVMPAIAASLNLNCSGDYDSFYSTLFSAFGLQKVNNAVMPQLMSAYCVSRTLL